MKLRSSIARCRNKMAYEENKNILLPTITIIEIIYSMPILEVKINILLA
jgi:hypothetical protein